MPGREAIGALAIASVAIRPGAGAALGPLPQNIRPPHRAAVTGAAHSIVPRRP